MTDPQPAEDATLFPKTAGERLREARETQGLSLAEIAARTRVPVRQLEAIEASNYAALPSITYSVGFAKAYARAVGLDEVAIGQEVRGLNTQPGAARRTEYEAYAVDDATARVPTRGLVIAAVIVALLVVVGGGLWYGTSLFRSEDAAPVAAAPAEPAPAAVPAAAPAPATGPVVLTATDQVWLKIYDGSGKTLFEGTLNAGDHYAVPADAANPMINVGRPDKLQVTVGGAAVAPLGDGSTALKDVEISPAALAARGAPPPTASPSPGAGPSPAATDRPATARHAARERRATAPSPAGGPLNIAAPAAVPPEPAAPAPTPAATPAP